MGRFRPPAAGKDYPALLARDINEGQHPVLMQLRSQGTHFSLGIERVTQPDRFGQRHESIEKVIRDALMEQEARAGDTSLTLIVEDRERAAADSSRDVRICKDDVRTFATQLELEFLRLPADAATMRRPVPVEPVNDTLPMSGCSAMRCPAVVTVTGHNIHDAVRNTDLLHELADPQC